MSSNYLNQNIEGVGFIDENHGCVGGWGDPLFAGRTSFTDNGGVTWSGASTLKNINRLRFFPEMRQTIRGYCCGSHVYRYELQKPGTYFLPLI